MNRKTSKNANRAANNTNVASAPGLTDLRFDPDAILLRDPGLLLDRHFLAALHAEMRNET